MRCRLTRLANDLRGGDDLWHLHETSDVPTALKAVVVPATRIGPVCALSLETVRLVVLLELPLVHAHGDDLEDDLERELRRRRIRRRETSVEQTPTR